MKAYKVQREVRCEDGAVSEATLRYYADAMAANDYVNEELEKLGEKGYKINGWTATRNDCYVTMIGFSLIPIVIR